MKKCWLSCGGRLLFALAASLIASYSSAAVTQQDSLAGALTDDDRIFHRDGFSYDWVATVERASIEDGIATFELKTQKAQQTYLRLFAVAPGVVRLQWGAQGSHFQMQSPMLLEGQGVATLPAQLQEQDDSYIFKSADAEVEVRIGKSPFTLTLVDKRGQPSFESDRDDDVAGIPITPALGFRSTADARQAFLSFRLRNDEHVFGLSEKYNKVEKTGTRATIWSVDTMGTNTLDLAYKAIPLLFSTRGWGLLVHSSAKSYWEIGSFSTISGSVLVDEDHLDAFLFTGSTLKQLLYGYTGLAGRPAMPPLWALGIWMSRASYESRQQVEDIVAAARSRRFPMDVINIDPGWMQTHYYFKIGVDGCDFQWNTEKFPSPKDMFRELTAQGMAASMWINPYLPEGTPIYEEAKAKNFMVSDGHGGVARLEGGQPVGEVDFTNPAAAEWWKEHLRELLRMGTSVFKPDYGEGIARSALFFNGQTGETMHNLYTMLYTQAAFEAVREVKRQGMVWRRSGYVGSQRYPGTWAGDTQPTWAGLKSAMRGGLSAGISGEAFWSHDIGGFAGPKPSSELYIRWAQFGLFSPLSRFHGNTPREPWEYGPEAERIVTRYARLRYRLMPYLVKTAEESVRTGVPMLRHMALEFPDEPNVHTLDDQYALGPDLLVAPIIVEGTRSRSVYFPRGKWRELEHPEIAIAGPGFHQVNAPLDYIPVFVREGSAVPMLTRDVQHLKDPAVLEHSRLWPLRLEVPGKETKPIATLVDPAQGQADSFSTELLSAQQRGGDFGAVADLAQRVAPWLAQNLVLKRIPRERSNDVFELETVGGKLIIRASGPPSAAMGLNWYLRYYCHRTVSHLGNNISPIKALPELSRPLRRTSRFKHRYFLNYCTLNYTLAFADWERWEREIDWMALNGVNLALATTGTEAVWQNTLRRIGYSEPEILEFIPGPAYTAWWLMGNLEGWGGPVTQRMIDERAALQKKILGRMRELGIEPVLQGFYGMVPASLSRKFPEARIVDQGFWGGFRRPKILLSSDPRFAHFASIYYEEIKNLYGAVRFFGGDPFHEGGQTAGLDVAALARNVQNSMLQANSEAVWVLQGWQGNPKDDLLNGLLRSRVLVLNLESHDWEKRKGFNGSPWVWGVINNFGENTGMFGDLQRIASEPIRASRSPYGRTMVGIGALMEGVNNNPVVYDLLFEMAWHSEPVDVRQWVGDYVKYRYGETTPGLDRAWQLMLETVYSSGYAPQSIFCARPSLQVKGVSTWGTTQIGYDPAKLEEAAREFLRARTELGNNDAYQLDAVDLVRQVLTNRGLVFYRNLVSTYEARDRSQFHQVAKAFLQLIRDQDSLLGTRREFLLGYWLAEARAMAQSDEERVLDERNARTQITYWGPDDPATDLHDYASKEWSGLLRDFYLPRWEMFIRELDARSDGKPAAEINYFEFEKRWAEQRNEYPAAPSGDPVATAAIMLSRASNRPQLKSQNHTWHSPVSFLARSYVAFR